MGLKENVVRLRKALHWSQPRLAQEVGATQGTISAIEIGTTRNPTILPDLARALGVTVEELVANGPLKPSDEAIPAEISGLSRVKLAQLEAVVKLKEGRGQIWQITTDNMNGFAARGTYIVADVGAPVNEGDLVLAKKRIGTDIFVIIFRLLFSSRLHYVSDDHPGSEPVNDNITIFATVDRETKV